jgi:hypothetical protein
MMERKELLFPAINVNDSVQNQVRVLLSKPWLRQQTLLPAKSCRLCWRRGRPGKLAGALHSRSYRNDQYAPFRLPWFEVMTVEDTLG